MGSGLGEPTQVHLDWVSRVMLYKQFIYICKHHVTLLTQSRQTWVGSPSYWVLIDKARLIGL